MTKKDTLAVSKAILALTYGEMMDMAYSLSTMIEKDVRDSPKTPEDFASILYDWAGAQS